jgi:FMN phosphatase YigB (HAD superfamily)
VSGQAITFDFHNTLAACPEWFELEVRRLPSSFLHWWAEQDGHEVTPQLVAEADDRYRRLRRAIMDHGNELSAEACLDAVFAQMRLRVPEDALLTGSEHLMRQALAGLSPMPGAVETVREIHRAGILLGVISSAVYHPFIEWALESFGIREAFRAIVTSASAGYYKSRSEIYVHAADALGAAPGNMVHVGDSLRFDVGGASRVGMGTVWLRSERASAEDESFEPDLTLDTLDSSAPQILALLRSRQPQGDVLGA